ncbi:MAG: hypothetical protein WBP29_00200 [Candidatus Zixiibacteriota bacterium]
MNAQKLILAIVVAGIALLVLEYLRRTLTVMLVRKFGLAESVDVQFLTSFLINFVFCVMLPAVVYSALYPILPFTSFRSGFFIALFVFGVGQVPLSVRTYNQYRLSSALTAFEMLWNLLTLLVTLGTITYLYHY